MNENRGVIEVSDEVIRHIIHICSRDVPGVACVSEESFMNGAFKMLRSSDFPKGIRITNGETDRVKRVDVSIQVEFGVAIPAVAHEFQVRVKDQVESISGVRVEEVNVHVDGVQAISDAPSGPRVVTAPKGPGAVQDTEEEDEEEEIIEASVREEEEDETSR
jgi:uncharacterized alkaline shock family protein YloU